MYQFLYLLLSKKMNYKLLLSFIAVLILGIILLCDKITDDPWQYDPIPDTIPAPEWVKVDSLKIIHYDSTADKRAPTDDSITYGSFIVSWDTVSVATMYMVYLFDSDNNYLGVFITDSSCRYIDSLVPNQTYIVELAAYQVIDSTTTLYSNRTNYNTEAPLWQPQPPDIKDITYNSSNNNIQVTWKPTGIMIDSADVTGYHVYLLKLFSSDSTCTLQVVPTGPAVFTATLDTNLITKNESYKITIRTDGIISEGIICSSYVYSDSTGNDTAGVDKSFLLPYVYLSTYTKPGDTIIGTINYEMVGVKGGIFAMGDIWDNSYYRDGQGKPVHEVILSSFYMGKSEITNTQYAQFLNDVAIDTVIYDIDIIINATDTIIDTLKYTVVYDSNTIIEQNFKKQFISYNNPTFVVDSVFKDHPVSGIYWKGAALFCNWLSGKAGIDSCYASDWTCNLRKKGFRLPTEAEFEYVHAKAFDNNRRTKRRYPWGYAVNTTLYSADSASLKEVGKFNAINGFFDMSGNVKEWCSDLAVDEYNSSLAVNPIQNSSSDSVHVMRGGSHKESANANSSSWRHLNKPQSMSDCGFRLVRKAD
jgi:formylglycine-generating enzyme required for sulfatase activity